MTATEAPELVIEPAVTSDAESIAAIGATTFSLSFAH